MLTGPIRKLHRVHVRPVAVVILVVFVVLAPVPGVHAGDVWLFPDPALLERGTVQVRLLEDGDRRAFATGDGVRLQRIWQRGRQNLRVADDGVARFDVKSAGTQLLAYGDGAHFCKAFVFAGRPVEGGQLHLSEVGQRLEIVPQDDPIALVQGATALEVQVLFEREPLAFATVEAVALDAAGRELGAAARARTDEIGLAAVALGRTGRWLVRVRKGKGDAAVTSTLLLTRKDGW